MPQHLRARRGRGVSGQQLEHRPGHRSRRAGEELAIARAAFPGAVPVGATLPIWGRLLLGQGQVCHSCPVSPVPSSV